MLLLFLIAFLAHIIGNIVTAALRIVMLGWLNRIGGILIGAAEGVLLLSLLFCMARSEFMPDALKEKVAASRSAQYVRFCRGPDCASVAFTVRKH
jgi:membrane protein required for colicin V production